MELACIAKVASSASDCGHGPVADDLAARYAARLPVLDELAASLQREVREALSGVAHVDRVNFRSKEPGRFVEKAAKLKDGRPRYEDPLREIEDQVAGRVLVFFRRDIEPIEAILRDTFRTQEVVTKEPRNPKEFDYESRHQVFLVPMHLAPPAWTERADLPIAFEFQVRTLFMHAWAEPQHDLGYKGEALSHEATRLLAWAAASAWGADHAFEEVLDISASADFDPQTGQPGSTPMPFS